MQRVEEAERVIDVEATKEAPGRPSPKNIINSVGKHMSFLDFK